MIEFRGKILKHRIQCPEVQHELRTFHFTFKKHFIKIQFFYCLEVEIRCNH